MNCNCQIQLISINKPNQNYTMQLPLDLPELLNISELELIRLDIEHIYYKITKAHIVTATFDFESHIVQ